MHAPRWLAAVLWALVLSSGGTSSAFTTLPKTSVPLVRSSGAWCLPGTRPGARGRSGAAGLEACFRGPEEAQGPAAELSDFYVTGMCPEKPNTGGNGARKAGNLNVTFQDVKTAVARLRGVVRRTSCAMQPDLSRMTGTDLYLKKEFQQYTGAFKERGARNTLEELLAQSLEGGPDVRRLGVVAASAGNHALGLAYHGGLMGIPVTVCMPLGAPMTKVNKCLAMGAHVIQHGENFGETKRFAMSAPEFEGIPYIDPFNDPSVIAGAGSIGLEILNQVPDVDVIVVPVGGSGLIAGVSLAVKSLRPDVQIIGAEPENAPSLSGALSAGKPVSVDVSYTVADGLSVPIVGETSFRIAKNYVDRVVTVPEELIPLAILRLVEMERAVVEGAGATALAALLPGGPLDIPELKGKTVCAILGGGNIDSTTLGRIIDRGLAADRRLLRFHALIADRPGTMSEFAGVVGGAGANIKDLYHDRAWTKGAINMLTVQCVVELGGPAHEERLKKVLQEHKYNVQWPD